jgi:hypothetical protein
MYEVKITWYESGTPDSFSFRSDETSIDDLKISFLKRFGNIRNVPNRLLKEKALVKKLTHSATSLVEWVDKVNTETRWRLEIRKL